MGNNFRLSTLISVLAATLATVPAASATTIKDDISVGGTLIGTLTITQGGTCNGMSISSSSVCVDIQMTSGAVRLGGPVIGFSGNLNVNGATVISDVSVGSLSVGACGGVTKELICFDAKGSLTTPSLFFVLSNADTLTGITVGNVHVAGSFCGGSGTCFATTTQVSAIPEPGSMVLMGTGLIGLGYFAHRCATRDSAPRTS